MSREDEIRARLEGRIASGIAEYADADLRYLLDDNARLRSELATFRHACERWCAMWEAITPSERQLLARRWTDLQTKGAIPLPEAIQAAIDSTREPARD